MINCSPAEVFLWNVAEGWPIEYVSKKDAEVSIFAFMRYSEHGELF
jgi:hypothetical protein